MTRTEIEFDTYQEYRDYLDNLPEDADYDEPEERRIAGGLCYLAVTLNNGDIIRINNVPRNPDNKPILIEYNSVVSYTCPCGTDDEITIEDDEHTGSKRGCCGITVKAVRNGDSVDLFVV